MRIWIDLANSPHVPFFKALIPELLKRGHAIEITARDFAETVELARAAGLPITVIGSHGGKQLSGKGGNLVARALALRAWARKRRFDLALSHNSYSQIVAARLLRIRTVTLMDYEHQPANHLAFRFAQRVVVPTSFPERSLRRFGVSEKNVRRYGGTKEDVYLAEFQPNPAFADELKSLGVQPSEILIVVRPPAEEALYHQFENELFGELMDWLATQEAKVVLLPRNKGQRQRWHAANFVVPERPLDGPNLIAASDLVISAGGTMNREAAALGVPAATIYAGRWAAIDEELCRADRLIRVTSAADFQRLPLKKKSDVNARAVSAVRDDVLECILN